MKFPNMVDPTRAVLAIRVSRNSSRITTLYYMYCMLLCREKRDALLSSALF